MKTHRYNYIVVEGPIGVGKSSLTERLASHFGAETIYEKVEENPFLKGFYEDQHKHAFSTQIFFLLSRYRQLKNANQVDLFSRTVVADYMLEKDFIFAELNLNDEEFVLYNDVYRLLTGHVAKPDLVIFLTARTSELIRRVKKRGRSFEAGISEKYIEEVNEAYHRFFFQYEGGPILQVNTNGLDFVENEEDFNKLLEKIESPIRGKEVYNPLGSI